MIATHGVVPLLGERLLSRRPEIERAVVVRVEALAEPANTTGPEYREGLRAAISVALDYALGAIQSGEYRLPEIPVFLLAQARLAARNGVGVDKVLRRYVAGFMLVTDFAIEEAEGSGCSGGDIKSLLRGFAGVFDHLLAAVSEEYAQELRAHHSTARRRQVRKVERLLAGERLSALELAYDFEGRHLAIVAAGPGVIQTIRNLARDQDAQPLIVEREPGVAWAWLGSRRQVDPGAVHACLSSASSRGGAFAVGEPGRGLEGWRLSHQQAAAAFRIAIRNADPVVLYVDVALLASAAGDDVLGASLRDTFPTPLTVQPDGGESITRTLKAYFAAGRNVSSCAAALSLSRQTVTNRLRTAEELIGQPLEHCAAALETALHLGRLDQP